jgi:hypothetical protein
MQTVTAIRYGIFECKACIESDQSDDCGDHCSGQWADHLPPLGCDEFWPTCSCCGGVASLVSPLLAV